MTKVKICGITNLEDALSAVDAGADALGFNFYEKSPRYITPAGAEEIIAKLPPAILTMGVFVNSSLAGIETVLSIVPLEFIQLHGNEGPAFVIHARLLSSAKVLKAFRVSVNFKASSALDYEADHCLLDTDSRSFGGSGETFDWETALEFKNVAPEFYLAGGLTPDNVGEAIRKIVPFAVDVCSGVESVKGKKDRLKVNAFIRNVKSAL